MEPVLEEPAGMINNHAPQKNKIIKQQEAPSFPPSLPPPSPIHQDCRISTRNVLESSKNPNRIAPLWETEIKSRPVTCPSEESAGRIGRKNPSEESGAFQLPAHEAYTRQVKKKQMKNKERTQTYEILQKTNQLYANQQQRPFSSWTFPWRL